MRIHAFIAFILFAITCAGCASILAHETQKVTVLSKTEGSTIEMQNNKYENDSISVEIKKQKTFITNSKEGYLDETLVLYPYKRSPLIFANMILPLVGGVLIGSNPDIGLGITWVFAGLGFAIMYLDQAPNSFLFSNETIKFNQLKRIPKLVENQKFLYVDKTEFDWNDGDVTINYYSSPKDYYKSNLTTVSGSNSAAIKGEAFKLSEQLNNVLTEFELTDTTVRFFDNKFKSLLIDCTLDKAKIVYVEDVFVQAEMMINWRIKDVNQKELISKVITAKSNPISTDKGTDQVLSNALRRNLLTLLSDDSVMSILSNNLLDDIDSLENWHFIQIEQIDSARGVNNAVKSVVTIKLPDGHGSGCIISSDGYIITNFHVVSGNDSVEVIFNDNSSVIAKVVRINPRIDLALLKVDRSCPNVLYIGNDKDVELGMDVFSIGTPTNILLGQSVSKGIVSGYREFDQIDHLQTDVKINSGNSGGALITKDGMLIGITNAKIVGVGVEGIGFAIPCKYIFSELKLMPK